MRGPRHRTPLPAMTIGDYLAAVASRGSSCRAPVGDGTARHLRREGFGSATGRGLGHRGSRDRRAALGAPACASSPPRRSRGSSVSRPARGRRVRWQDSRGGCQDRAGPRRTAWCSERARAPGRARRSGGRHEQGRSRRSSSSALGPSRCISARRTASSVLAGVRSLAVCSTERACRRTRSETRRFPYMRRRRLALA